MRRAQQLNRDLRLLRRRKLAAGEGERLGVVLDAAQVLTDGLAERDGAASRLGAAREAQLAGGEAFGGVACGDNRDGGGEFFPRPSRQAVIVRIQVEGERLRIRLKQGLDLRHPDELAVEHA